MKKPKKIPFVGDLPLHIFSKISICENECWNWNGYTVTGYGRVERVIDKKRNLILIHRLFYEIFKGELFLDKVSDHICRNKRCCNPEHLRQITQVENITFNHGGFSQVNREKEYCSNGHQFSRENTYLLKRKNYTMRLCRKCRVNQKKEKRLEKKLQKLIANKSKDP